jgi:hypothetical protein
VRRVGRGRYVARCHDGPASLRQAEAPAQYEFRRSPLRRLAIARRRAQPCTHFRPP